MTITNDRSPVKLLYRNGDLFAPDIVQERADVLAKLLSARGTSPTGWLSATRLNGISLARPLPLRI